MTIDFDDNYDNDDDDRIGVGDRGRQGGHVPPAQKNRENIFRAIIM